MMETTPEPVLSQELLSPPTAGDAEPHFAADYLVALLSARVEARKKTEGEPQDVAVEMPHTIEP